jgi:hypothetical protein
MQNETIDHLTTIYVNALRAKKRPFILVLEDHTQGTTTSYAYTPVGSSIALQTLVLRAEQEKAS